MGASADRESVGSGAGRGTGARAGGVGRLRSAVTLAAHALGAPAAGVWRDEGICLEVHGPVAPHQGEAVAAAALAARRPVASGATRPPLEPPRGFAFAAAAPIVAEDGRPLGALCVFDRRPRRLTPRRREILAALATLCADLIDAARTDPAAAVEAERMRARFEAIFENTDAVVFIKRRNGELLAANRKYHAMAGVGSVVGLTDHDLYGPETGAALRARDAVIFETGEPFTGEERVAFPNGEEVIYLSSKFLIHDPAIEDMVLCGIATDITAQKRLQSSLEQSRREAEAANRVKSEFLATMSHEIRTPMNGVLGMLALLTSTRLDDRQRGMAQIARDSAASLLTILNDILDYARIETRDMDFARVPFSLPAAVRGAAAPLRLKARKKGLSLRVEVDAAAPERVVGDPARFRQVLGALVNNAIKFTEAGSVRIHVAPCAVGAGPGLRVTVRDTGVGVPTDAQARIFGGFAQADGSHTRRFGGLGLGLSIAKQLVEGMGGQIGLDSAPGKGSVFWFTLPAQPPALRDP